MSDRTPTPEWYTPGGTITAPRHDEPGTNTAPLPVQAYSAPRRGRRRTAEITTVAVLAALLSSGGTVAETATTADSARSRS